MFIKIAWNIIFWVFLILIGYLICEHSEDYPYDDF